MAAVPVVRGPVRVGVFRYLCGYPSLDGSGVNGRTPQVPRVRRRASWHGMGPAVVRNLCALGMHDSSARPPEFAAIFDKTS
jgi:hypothetical protein